MKTLITAIVALAAIAGAANASTVAPAQADTVVEWGCDYGYGR